MFVYYWTIFLLAFRLALYAFALGKGDNSRRQSDWGDVATTNLVWTLMWMPLAGRVLGWW